ncbi:MAG: CocE/NonD family hydrolase [Chloroflexi bacterium]|nr:CocE/NonD family hydrolase [Chloroflexota bacterium]
MSDALMPQYDVRIETDVPAAMRDGTILRADVAWPVPEAGADETFPVLLTRTPYKKRQLPNLAAAGYIAVSQDVRGRYASDGPYEPVHQPCGASLDREDGYDTVLWAAGLPGANGRVGVFGTSYPAWEAWELAISRPGPLQAMYVSGMSVTSTAVEAIPRPGRRVQWFYYTGAPDARRRLDLLGHHTREAAEALWRYERHKWLWFLPWSELPEHVLGPLTPYFKEYLQNPTRDHFRFAGQHHEIDVPIFHRTGWHDRFVSTIDHFVAMRAHGRTERTRAAQRLMVGPWGHTANLTRKVGDVDVGPAAEMDDQALMLRWFDYWLRDRETGALDAPPVRYFIMGRNEWCAAETWPPAGTQAQRFYLHSGGCANTAAGDGRLSSERPNGAGAAVDRYDYDPRDPVPTIWPLGDQNVPLDHRPLDWRHDLLVYVSDPMAEPLEVAGDPVVELHAASSERDTDFVARLADVHPDGFVQPLCYGIVRARYRDGFDRPQLLTPGETVRYTIQLRPVAFTILPGHPLRLEITSSDFPNYDRNHNTGDDDFSDPTLLTAHQTIHHSAERPSYVVLPVV